MDLQEILRALQARKITPEDAQKELIRAENAVKLKPQAPDLPRFEEMQTGGESHPSLAKGAKKGIAIIGMSGRYPGAGNLAQYWDNLLQGRNSIREIPNFRWNVHEYYDPSPAQKGKIYCKWLGMLEDIEYFDPLFFNISPGEAEGMDPQHRLFLQEGYKAFEDAGYNAQLLSNKKCGVYLGIMGNEYGMLLYQNSEELNNITGNSAAIAAARLPYFLNLKGPAIPIDTACSSSLVGMHLACQALTNREIDMALVGGVTLYLTPESYIGMCSAGMLSPEGQCKAFDNSADGFVPGEGVGTLVLKRLEDAEADHDHIYGVIIGSGINQDGKTNGITAPSVNSQIELERDLYEKYKIPVETINYVEMHGTGTKLGDPIELEALATVFKEKTDKRNYCAIGSVKSNIGHTSAAAGIASVQKVLLSMRHKKLVPTLNFKKHNEHFNFEESPFYVNTELKDWKPAMGNCRRASVSSFGYSGTNAHLVIQEYLPEKSQPVLSGAIGKKGPALFVLSAKSEEQLKTYAQSIKDYIETHEDICPADAAYTLQVGRDASDYRLAFPAASREDMVKGLDAYLQHRSVPALLTACVKKGKPGAASGAENKLKALLQERKLEEIAELWVKGVPVDWNELYGDERPYRVSLPAYPFAKERCWAAAKKSKPPANSIFAASDGIAFLHPFLHRNTSDFEEQRFSSTFTGEESFLSDHVVEGKKMLPGVVCLEMARAAVELAARGAEKGRLGIQLQNIGWTRPVVVEDQPVQIHIGLFVVNSGEIAYEIYSEPRESEPEIVIYSQGSAVIRPVTHNPALDIAALREQCDRNSISSGQCYTAFGAAGICYGPTYQGIEVIYTGQGKALAKLSLLPRISDTSDALFLHPGLLDSALQASIGLMTAEEDTSTAFRPFLPFALEELEIFDRCTSDSWAYIRDSKGGRAGDCIRKLDIDVCDAQGKICVRFKGFSLRAAEKSAVAETIDTLLLEPYWKEEKLTENALGATYARQVVVLCEIEDSTAGKIQEQLTGIRCLSLQSDSESIEERFRTYATQVYHEVKGIFKEKPVDPVLVQVVVALEGEGQLFSGLTGLLKSAQLENPKLIGQLIEVECENDAAGIIEKLQENRRSPVEHRVRYRRGVRYVAGWSEMVIPPKKKNLPWKEGGVYLITGGAGGLGLAFAKEIAACSRRAILILTGRSPLGADRQAQIKELEIGDAHIEYRQADVTDRNAVDTLIREIQKDYGRLDGILHSAGITQDNFILRKPTEEFQKVLAPKVSGTVFLDQATKNQKLDFFVLFSSIAGSLGNIGQADYAAANAFMDAYAIYRNSLVDRGLRWGRTLAVNWPLWKEGGMHVNVEAERAAAENTGFASISTVAGMEAFRQAFASGRNQVMVLRGKPEQIRQKLLSNSLSGKPAEKTPSESVLKTGLDTCSPVENVQEVLTKVAAQLLGVEAEDIDTDAEFHELGFDPVMLVRFTDTLNQEYKLTLQSSVLLEHSTVRTFSRYLIEKYPDIFLPTRGITEPSIIEERKATAPIPQDFLRDKAASYFKKLVSSVIKLPVNRIEEDASFEKYGLDSILVMRLTRELEKNFGVLSKTLFFEYRNIKEITDYFLDSHREQLLCLLGGGMLSDSRISGSEIAAKAVKQLSGRHKRPRFAGVSMKWEQDTAAKALDIAIIGMSGRYPAAKNIQEFWMNLQEGKDCIVEIPKDRWEHSVYFDADKNKPGKTYSKWGGFIEGVDRFDPLFFNISPREAEIMDPQERLFLECAYEVLEDAGYTRETLGSYRSFGLEGNVGVYVGVMYEEYQLYGAQETIQGRPLVLPGNPSSIANRVSYWCNFHGPSLAVDSMCSSSLTAIHLACQSLQRGECEAAIAGGVNVSIHPNKYLALGQGKFMSSSGRCESFGQGGDGYVPGEGVGAVLLKPMSKAVADGDHIYGIIKGTAINHGGRTNGYTVPNPNAQASVIERAFEEAGINPRTVSYIEAHGTGTALGDPIEIAGLTKAFQKHTNDKHFCAIGSVKSNIGHCESAAGIAGLTKVLLQFQHQQLVLSLHSKLLNPHIDFSNTPFAVQQNAVQWKRPRIQMGGRVEECPRRAGISAFGAGGSNAHIVVEEYIPQETEECQPTVTTNNPVMVVLSAKSKEQLKVKAEELLCMIGQGKLTDSHLIDMAYTLQVGREAMEERLAVITGSILELEEKLKEFLEGQEGIAAVYRGQANGHNEALAVFTGDDELQEAIGKWIRRRKYSKLMELWVKGLKFDWNEFYGEVKPRRISLPTYPFARERYWAPVAKAASGSASGLPDRSSAHSPQTENVILIKGWEHQNAAASVDMLPGSIVILGTWATKNLALGLFENRAEFQVIHVFHGINSLPGGIFADFYSAQAGEELYRQVKDIQNGRTLIGVIDITAYDSEYEQSFAVEAGKLRFLQKVIEHNRQEGCKLLQITYRLQNFLQEKTTLSGARSVGLYRMLGAEYKQVQSMTMDSDCPIDETQRLGLQIQTEFFRRNTEKLTECCYRNDERYTPVLKVSRIEEEGPESAFPPGRYGDRDVILITGGTRGIGAAVARHVVSQGVRKLVIMGREALPESSEWKGILKNKEKPEIEEKLKALRSLTDQGVLVHYYHTPLTDEEGIENMVSRIRKTLGPITGVFHCAGQASANPAFYKKDMAAFETVYAPKVKGLVTLHKALENEPLHFFILFSSICTMAPMLAAGQSDYAAANTYMDYYALNQRGEGKPYFISIQWPAWSETGMAAGPMHTPMCEKTGIAACTTAQGLMLMDAVKSSPHFLCAPCTIIPNKFLWNFLLKMEFCPMKEYNYTMGHKKEAAPGISERPEMGQDLRVLAVQWLRMIFESELKLKAEQLDERKPLDEYGIESITLAQLTQTMQLHVDKPIIPSLLLEHNSIAALADYFVAYHAEALQKSLTPTATARKDFNETADVSGNDVCLQPVTVKIPAEMKSIGEEPTAGLSEDIAVIGMSCRFPGAPSKEAYWKLLSEGASAIRPLTEKRWHREENCVDYGGWLEEIERFDPAFFNIHENDAAIMDPQARIILEESLRAVYDAGYEHKQLCGQKIGVYVGGRTQSTLGMDSILKAPNPILGMGQNYLAANISRFLNFKGPSMVVDTACSSGITGMQLAMDGLRGKRMDMALVGAVNILINPFAHDLLAARNILSKDGLFHIFDKRSGGEVLGEGAGIVMIKRLQDAVRDGNHIYGTIKAISINNDGRTLGPGSPDFQTQKQVMQEALALSGKKPEDIGYIEVNGGGSPIVDVIEIKALSESYQLDKRDLGSCFIGSVKPNIGHLLLASGLAGFIRCVLSVYHKKIPPFLSATVPFDHYDFAASRIRFNREEANWNTDSGKKRMAAQNSFPDGGTNCHVIIEEFVPEEGYAQNYFSKPAPVMEKKYYSLHTPRNSAVTGETSEHVKAAEQEAGQQHLYIKNVWGEYDGQNI